MAKKKPVRTRGKIQFSKYFQELKESDKVAVVAEQAMQPNFPKRLQGKTGIVEGKKGKTSVIKIKDINKEKRFLIEPIHLRKIK